MCDDYAEMSTNEIHSAMQVRYDVQQLMNRAKQCLFVFSGVKHSISDKKLLFALEIEALFVVQIGLFETVQHAAQRQ